MMILRYPGAEYSHGSVKYAIGSTVMATDQSPYQGLLGTIVEIRDGQDRETQNETPDIYCSFDTPVIPAEIEKLEKVFSILHGTPKTLQDISLQRVIMAPDRLTERNLSGTSVPADPCFGSSCKSVVKGTITRRNRATQLQNYPCYRDEHHCEKTAC